MVVGVMIVVVMPVMTLVMQETKSIGPTSKDMIQILVSGFSSKR